MGSQQKDFDLNHRAWLHCNEQAENVYRECMKSISRNDKEWKCTLAKHQDHVFCMHHEKDKINEKLKRLAVHVADVGAAGNSTTNPPVRSDLGN
jgi:hypothetical protein